LRWPAPSSAASSPDPTSQPVGRPGRRVRTGAVVPDPRDEDVATTTDLRHQQMLPDMVTIHQGLGRGPGPATVHGSASRNGDEEARITFRKLTSRARLDERRVGVLPFLTHDREPVPTSRSVYGARFLGVIGVSRINAYDVTGQAL
jgi:hypothetical protein